MFIFSLFSSSSPFLFPAFSFFLLPLFLSSSPLFTIGLQTTPTELLDEYAVFMVFVLLLLLVVSYVFSYTLPHIDFRNFALFFMLLSCIMVFTVNNSFLFYLFYELSLLPIVYIIINWGSYPERSVSSIIFFIYTAFFTFPFLFYIFYSVSRFSTLHFSMLSLTTTNPGTLCTLVVIFCFSVKLPIYGLHFWLPIAHVEAPTFGSIILAGVLLKLGGMGLVRFVPLLDLPLLCSMILSYLFIFLLVSTVICCYQSDFKRMVAYSSVSHIMPIPLLLLSSNILSINTLLLVIFFHGFASPVLFMLVGVIYMLFSTRQFLLIRGLVITSPVLSFQCIIAFFYTMSAPPFPSFISEVFVLVSSVFLSGYFYLFFGFFLFFSLVYNLNWFTNFLFSSSSPSSSLISFSFSYFISIFVIFLATFIFVPLFFLF